MDKKLINNKLEKIYNFVCSYVNNNGYPPSVREIAYSVGIKSTATVYDYLQKLIDKGLLTKSPTKKRAITLSKNSTSYKSIPIVGLVRAGLPLFAVENLDGYLPLPSDFCGNNDSFALKIQGDSMIDAGIYDKDIIIVEKTNVAQNGDIVVALVEDSATVKRIFYKNNQVILHPENQAFSDMIYDEVLILGKVKGLLRKI